jgi:release factor glutamine methyltransferase
MMTLDQLLHPSLHQSLPHGSSQVRQARLPRLEARMLLACVTGKSQEWLVAHGPDEVGAADAERFLALAHRRAAGEPMAYLCGDREFFSRPFQVTPDVLIPRPDTELLVTVALTLAKDLAAPQLLDLGTGSGILAVTLALERPDSVVTATDASSAALDVARANAAALGARRISFLLGDWWQALDGSGRGFDLVVSNPPYIAADDPHLSAGDLRYEPRLALAAGPHGDEHLRRIIAGAPAWLKPRGWLALEHGHEQGPTCRELLREHGFGAVATHRDLEHRDRVTVGQRPDPGTAAARADVDCADGAPAKASS